MNKFQTKTIEETKDYIGTWITREGDILHELFPNYRYEQARGTEKKVFQGTYRVTGNRIDYIDDSGFTAEGEIKNGMLFHGFMAFLKAN
ncbi:MULTISPECIES: Atu4866 domain-containing protein [Galbibacter]|uniref:Atu4866 domain-containing protein n=1 Tax=Galbibacter pacificus TaxID=2996052 RepID=A0ABT6FRH2_9FLAO|nr:Atu4866 domain-containing protein [Galbibacter pacificus]MDG3581652.1 Atu4866 domain-containing protein [Galbibacter pacificus]MDG3585874.1 Atu4866 domain-containing protein [Galbibacter pacificus]